MTQPPFHTLYCPICQTVYDNASYRRCPQDGSPLRTPEGYDVGWLGQIVQDRYRVLRVLGKGGMAQVYEAEHLATRRKVALKILEPRLATEPAALDRFRREAQILSRIAHPNVVAVEDFGTLSDGSLFMVMELLAGQSLQQVLEQRELAPTRALDVVVQVCEAVQAAHDIGVAHRDIKPGNIFLEASRQDGVPAVKVLDFGISKLLDERGATQVTKAGTVFGTPEYMSPQQARGLPADPRSDIYSVGVLLYRLLLGKVPFSGESYMEVLVKHITEPVVWPPDLAAKKRLPSAARDVVLKALDKNPEQRFASATALGEAVQALRDRMSSGYSMVGDEVDSVRVRASERLSVPLGFQSTTLATAKGHDNEVVALAPDVYWVGRRVGGSLECNTYLRVYRRGEERLSVIVDPGPSRDLQVIGAKVASVLGSIGDLDIAFLNHQDPDVSSNAQALQKVNGRLAIVCSQDTWRLVNGTGLDPRRFRAVEHFPDGVMRLATGHEVELVPTPYCHFRGAVMYYDRASRVLFTGDLFGGLTDSKQLLSRDGSWDGIDTFHQIYMPTSEAVRRALVSIRKLDPPPRLLAPQHGAVIPEDQFEALFEHLASLPMGLDIATRDGRRADYHHAIEAVIAGLVDLVGEGVVRTRLARFEGDGTFPDLIVFGEKWKVREIKLDPRPVAGAIVRELTGAVPAEHADAWLALVNEVQLEHGVEIPGVPAVGRRPDR